MSFTDSSTINSWWEPNFQIGRPPKLGLGGESIAMWTFSGSGTKEAEESTSDIKLAVRNQYLCWGAAGGALRIFLVRHKQGISLGEPPIQT